MPHSVYRDWAIWTPNRFGMWTATDYAGGRGQIAADTLRGLRAMIREGARQW